MKLEFEEQRANATPDQLCEMAETLWDAGAHLFRCSGTSTPPFSDEDKAPKYGEKWKTKRTHISDIKVWIKAGNLIGLAHPARNIGLSAIDCDKPVETLQAKFAEIGHQPLAVHISSGAKKKHGDVGYHAWFKTTDGTANHYWEGGEVYSTSTHFIVVYNLPALYHAYMRSQEADAPDIDLSAYTTDVNPAKRAKASTGGIVAGISIEDEEIPTDHRHDTTISKIGRAVEKALSKSELNAKLKPIIESYRLSFTDEDDPGRVGSMIAELPRLKEYANALWKKKGIRKRYEKRTRAVLEAVGNTPEASEKIKELIEEYRKEVVNDGLPTPEVCQKEILGHADYIIKSTTPKFEDSIVCKADHGTIEAWQEAAAGLGFGFRYNTLNESGQVLIPLRFESEENGGGQWKQIDDLSRSTIIAAIEKHALAYTTGKNPYLKGVFLPKEKSRDAITSLFTANRFCPFKEYLDGLPKWCGKSLINKSMERGGMMIDAGPFTESVQAYPWIFAVRNTLFPGSSNREHIVLHGPHNSGKSKFVKLMLPEHLLEYYNEAFSLDGSLKVKLERSMGKILMECSEFGSSAKDWALVKQWLTLSEVSGERLAYKEYAKRHRLTATTIFTTNAPELIPTDEAVLSRFIWANVETPATTLDGLVWTHFDSYYDAEHPEMGTWRDQYFAEALHIVNEYTEKVEYQTGGTKQISYRSNPKWLPKDHIPALIEWNKNAGGTFTTEAGDLASDAIQAIGLLQDWYRQMHIDNRNFFPTAELIHAIVCVRDGVDYSDWWELARDAKGDPLSGEARRKSEVERAISPIKLANAMPAVGEEMDVRFKKTKKNWETSDRKQTIRGFEMSYPKDE